MNVIVLQKHGSRLYWNGKEFTSNNPKRYDNPDDLTKAMEKARQASNTPDQVMLIGADVTYEHATPERPFAFHGEQRRILTMGGFQMLFKNGWTVSLISFPNRKNLEMLAWKEETKEEIGPRDANPDDVAKFFAEIQAK